MTHVTVDKLQNFLEIAIRSSTINNHPLKENFLVKIGKYSHWDTLYALSLYAKVIYFYFNY